MSKAFTALLGSAELAGAMGVAIGVLTQLAAIGLILLMLGAIQKKIFVWHTGFWGKHGTDGWHYELMLVVMCLVIITTDGGRFVLLKLPWSDSLSQAEVRTFGFRCSTKGGYDLVSASLTVENRCGH
jgi:uncharacterized membrane protein YphA (DoxX/SURF4 family)